MCFRNESALFVRPAVKGLQSSIPSATVVVPSPPVVPGDTSESSSSVSGDTGQEVPPEGGEVSSLDEDTAAQKNPFVQHDPHLGPKQQMHEMQADMTKMMLELAEMMQGFAADIDPDVPKSPAVPLPSVLPGCAQQQRPVQQRPAPYQQPPAPARKARRRRTAS